MNTRIVNSETLELVKRAEGFRAKAYLCPAGKPTIGYGHTKDVTEQDVKNGRTITENEAALLLRADLAQAEGAVQRLVRAPLTDGQFGALVDFIFNCGEGAFEGATLLKLVNAGNFALVPAELDKWHHVNGKDFVGLMARRAAEALLWASEPFINNVATLVTSASAAAVHIQNTILVNADRESNGGKVSAVIAALANDSAVSNVIDAVKPFADADTAHAMDTMRTLAQAAVTASVERLKLPDATLALFPY